LTKFRAFLSQKGNEVLAKFFMILYLEKSQTMGGVIKLGSSSCAHIHLFLVVCSYLNGQYTCISA